MVSLTIQSRSTSMVLMVPTLTFSTLLGNLLIERRRGCINYYVYLFDDVGRGYIFHAENPNFIDLHYGD